MSNNEPEYLKALRRQQRRVKSARQASPQAESGGASPAEREAVKWAREVAGQEPQVAPSLHGARCAILFKPASIDGRAPITLEGVESRDALVERLTVAHFNGHEVLGLYEVRSGRPLTAVASGDQTTFEAGPSRLPAKPLSPEQMLRRAHAEAEQRSRTRRVDDRPGGSRGDRGGKPRR